MILDLFSVLLYIGTFLIGINRGMKCPTIRQNRLFIAWLFIFLCFGYMTGSDWRGYEQSYYNDLYEWQYLTEPLSRWTFTVIPTVIPDFWLFLGLAKCLYLASVIHFYKKVVDNPVAVTACAIPMFLISLLIDNPLRYMLAMIPLTLVMGIGIDIIDKGLTKKRIILAVCLLLVASAFHNTGLVFLLFFPLAYKFRNITKWNRMLIFGVFIAVVVLTSSISLINSVKQLYVSIFGIFGEVKEYSGYDAENNASVFAIGNIIKIAIFAVVLKTRDSIVGKYKYSELIYTLTIYYFFLDRFTILIESGYRLTMPFMYFYAIYVILLIKEKLKTGKVILVYMTFAFFSTMWNAFTIIPYSNSIPYILTEHKPYAERNFYNFDAQKRRTGKDQTYVVTE